MATELTDAQVDWDRIAYLTRELLLAIGEDSEREGLQGTPGRVAGFWKKFIEYEPGNLDATFEAVTTDQMVVVSGMRVWSLCEHHLLPFWCDISIGYIAQDKVLGLSKFARVAHKHAHKLQIQERLVHEIADEIEALTGSQSIAVHARGHHTCMIMRGIRTDGTMMTSVMRGAFRQDATARSEFLSLVQ